PKVREIADYYLSNHTRIELVEPLEVVDFHNFAHQSYLILTDSGGVQEEAPSLGKPVLVLRGVRERPAGVAAGTVHMVGTNTKECNRKCRRSGSGYIKNCRYKYKGHFCSNQRTIRQQKFI